MNRECHDNEYCTASGSTGGWLQSITEPNFLPSFEFAAEFEGAYSWEATEHANFDLCPGHLLQLAALVANALAKLGRHMKGAID